MKNQQTNNSYLLFIALTAALGGFLFGYDTAVISGTIGFVKSKFALDAVMEGWFVSSAHFQTRWRCWSWRGFNVVATIYF